MKTILASVAAIALTGSAAIAQQIVLVPQPGTEGARAGSEQRFILVPAPRYEPGRQAAADGNPNMALELYERGYRQGLSDAQSTAQPAIDPTAIERIGRELFERGYVLGLLQAQSQAQAAAQQQGGDQNPNRAAQAATGESPQADVPEARLRADTSEQHGSYVTDGNGRAVYMFEADQQGQGAQKAVSNCYDACAEAWPPVLTRSKPVQAGGPVNSDLISTIERRDGTMQVTHNGWPLYYYVKDTGPGKTTGHDVHGFGGGWYLVRPSGDVIGHE